jgi:hypothetical protein
MNKSTTTNLLTVSFSTNKPAVTHKVGSTRTTRARGEKNPAPAPATHDPTRRERETRNPLPSLFPSRRPLPFPPFSIPPKPNPSPLAAASG